MIPPFTYFDLDDSHIALFGGNIATTTVEFFGVRDLTRNNPYPDVVGYTYQNELFTCAGQTALYCGLTNDRHYPVGNYCLKEGKYQDTFRLNKHYDMYRLVMREVIDIYLDNEVSWDGIATTFDYRSLDSIKTFPIYNDIPIPSLLAGLPKTRLFNLCIRAETATERFFKDGDVIYTDMELFHTGIETVINTQDFFSFTLYTADQILYR